MISRSFNLVPAFVLWAVMVLVGMNVSWGAEQGQSPAHLPGLSAAVPVPPYDPLVTPILGSSLWFGNKLDPAPAFALRFSLPCSSIPDYICPSGHWSVELGTIFQHQVSGDFKGDTRTVDGNTWDVHLRSFYEVHAAAVEDLPHGQQKWVVPEAGLGVSFLHVDDNVVYTQTNPSPAFTQNVDMARSPVSPLLILGARCLAFGPITLGLDLTYTYYANRFAWGGQARVDAAAAIGSGRRLHARSKEPFARRKGGAPR
jgi:hypothetical protein